MSEIPLTSKVLIVDDDVSALFIYKTHLLRAGYRVSCASDVAQARELLHQEGAESFGAVITDYWMPGANGFDLLRHVIQLDRALSVILVTAEGEKDMVAKFMREGAFSFLDKPVSGMVIREEVAKAVEHTQKLRLQRTTMEEARAMGNTQRVLLGSQTAALRNRIRVYSRPHAEAGGDFAAAFPVSEDRFIVMVSDVSGHDLTAAYCSAFLQGMARGMLDQGAGIDRVFSRLNRLLLDEWNGSGNVSFSLSACVADINLGKGTLSALNCGLPTPFVCDPDGWAIPINETGAHPLGWFDELPPSVSLPLEPGYLCFWSDGLEDVALRAGVAPLSLAFRLQTDPDSCEGLLVDLAADDLVTVMVDLGSSGRAGQFRRIPLLSERIPGARLNEIDGLQTYLENCIRFALPQINERVLCDAMLCLREALINALLHGCRKQPNRYAYLQACLDTQNQILHLSITDDGKGHFFDFLKHEELAAEQLLTEHRGLVLVKNLAKQMHLSARGNRLIMDFPLQDSNPPNQS